MIKLNSPEPCNWKNIDIGRTVHVTDANNEEFQATIIPHTTEFLKFFEKSKKDFPNYSFLQHHELYEEFKEFKEMTARFKETSRRLL